MKRYIVKVVFVERERGEMKRVTNCTYGAELDSETTIDHSKVFTFGVDNCSPVGSYRYVAMRVCIYSKMYSINFCACQLIQCEGDRNEGR